MKPGEITSCDWDDEAHLGVVLATSRHKTSLTVAEAAPILADALARYVGDDDGLRDRLTTLIAERKPYNWRSVTKREIDDGTHECRRGCCDGDRCTAGSGTAWWTVLSFGVDEAENLDLTGGSTPNPTEATAQNAPTPESAS